MRSELPSRRNLLLGAAARPAAAGLPVAAAPAPAGLASRRAEVNGTTLHFVVAGRGSPVLLIHGWPETWYAWRKIIPLLAERRTVIAPDMRSFGDSGRPATGYDKLTIAADLRALVQSLDSARSIWLRRIWADPWASPMPLNGRARSAASPSSRAPFPVSAWKP